MDHIQKLDAVLAQVAAIEDPIQRTIAWTEVMSWLQETLPLVRVERRNSAWMSKHDHGEPGEVTYVELAKALKMTESTVRRLVAEAEK